MIIDDINIVLAGVSSVIRLASYKRLSKDQLIKLISTKFSSAYKKFNDGFAIYRGMKSYSDYILATPGIRVSINTNNFYTRLFSGVLPSWKITQKGIIVLSALKVILSRLHINQQDI